MKKFFVHDGDDIDKSILDNFSLSQRDIRRSCRIDEKTGDEVVDEKVNFVGFIVENNCMLISLPKKFEYSSSVDLKNIFEVIKNFSQPRPSVQVGDDVSNKYDVNYPFDSFFKIYRYYKQYGIHLGSQKNYKAGITGKINWKRSIDKSVKYIYNNSIIISPIISTVSNYFYDLIALAMINAINETYDMFGIFFRIDFIDKPQYDYSFFKNRKGVCEILREIQAKLYNDVELELVKNLILFYSSCFNGGKYYFKHYNFSSIWEVMTREYLSAYCEGYDAGKGFILGNNALKFEKKIFYPNAYNPKNFISIDSYAEYDRTQMIVDAKYYDDLDTINYKQICYSLFLKDFLDSSGNAKYYHTYSILVIPDSMSYRDTHFGLIKSAGIVNKDLIIYAEYLSIKKIVEFYARRKIY